MATAIRARLRSAAWALDFAIGGIYQAVFALREGRATFRQPGQQGLPDDRNFQ
jgi:hypothetical protein